jgi:hypothetical protein
MFRMLSDWVRNGVRIRSECCPKRAGIAGSGGRTSRTDSCASWASFALSRREVEMLAAEAERTYDVAVEVRHTPVVMDWNVSRDARELERAAVRELINEGHHREALFELLLVRTAVQGIIENDGGEEARAMSSKQSKTALTISASLRSTGSQRSTVFQVLFHASTIGKGKNACGSSFPNVSEVWRYVCLDTNDEREAKPSVQPRSSPPLH